MNCIQVQNNMSAYIDGELMGTEMLAIRSHLTVCPQCQREYSQIRATKVGVGAMKVNEPDGFLAQRLVALATAQTIEPKFTARSIAALVATAAVAAVLAVTVFNAMSRGDDRTRLANDDRFDAGSDQAVTMPDMGAHAPIVPVSR